MYTCLSFSGQMLQVYLYWTFYLLQFPPCPLPPWQAGHSPLWHPSCPVGFELWTCLFTVTPPRSTILNLRLGSASDLATSLSIFNSSLFGVDGIIMGAMNPPRVAQFHSFLFFFFCLSVNCQSLGRFTGCTPSVYCTFL
jgi:hypothetical protein